MQIEMRRLHPRGAANRGICVDADGAMLGPSCALVCRTMCGFRSIDRDHANALQKCALGESQDRDWLFRQSQRIADALNKGEITLAQIYGLYIPVATLDDRQLARLSRIEFVKTYNPNEPRIPKGEPYGGEWTTGETSDATTENGTDGGAEGDDRGQDGQSDRSSERAEGASPPNPVLAAIGDQSDGSDTAPGAASPQAGNQSAPPESGAASPEPDLGDFPPPDFPSAKLLATPQTNAVLRAIAVWLARAYAILGGAAELDPRVRAVIAAIEATAWLADYAPKIFSYLDDPKSLAELQSAAVRPAPSGYEIHHIVEAQKDSDNPQSNARNFPNLIDSPPNLVRVPYWKHVEISSWYSRRNDAYGGVSPRAYLQGKSWDEQYKIGLQKLKDFGVLK